MIQPAEEIMKRRGIMQWTALALSVLLAAGVMTLFRACPPAEDGTWMHCHTVQIYLCGLGIAAAVIAAAGLLIRSRSAALVLDLAGAAAACIAALLPGTIMKMCMMDTMRCYAVMQPFARVMGVLLILVFGIDFIKVLRTKR